MTDKALIIGLKRGDKKVFKHIFDMYYRPLCAYMVNFTNDIAEAEDLAQSSFIKLWVKRKQLHIHTSLKSYLYKIAYHSYLRQHEKDKGRNDFFEKLKYEALAEEEMDDNADLERKIKRLEQLIADLPPKCRAVLLLKKKGLKYTEIAKKLNISIKTVETQMRIAFNKIREGFEDKA